MSPFVLLISVILAACARATPRAAPAVLLFTGAGTSPNDVAAIEAVLDDKRLPYASVSSEQLNAMTEAQMMAYQLMVVPGGNFIAISESLTPATTTNVHNAVQGGLNYLGICAGAFVAGRGSYNSFNLTSGTRFGFYAAEARGIRKTAVAISAVDASAIEHYWVDGPELTGWGAVVGKYPDGTPAIVEGASGKGWVILTGVHPEAPENWRRGMNFSTPASVANSYAATLVEAALHRTVLPHY
ncbi:MAG: BPL-N domain-containing protein [bacterium]